MQTQQTLMLWPYDEVRLMSGASATELRVESPWLSLTLEVPENETEAAQALVAKFTTQSLDPTDLHQLNRFFGPLETYPLCYTLPRAVWPQGFDHHEVLPESNAGLDGTWLWDHESALQFAQTPTNFDPLALFSVGRRFHLLDAASQDSTQDLYTFAKSLSPQAFARAAALIVRQNHFVTVHCHAALSPSLEIAQGARAKIADFMREEEGHDRILDVALRSITSESEAVPVVEPVRELMLLLKRCASQNLLAFALAVDFFERSAYQDSDPLAQMLAAGGLNTAARQIDRHMRINDVGEHENLAIEFLATMGPVSAAYAIEALKLAELVTRAMHAIAPAVHRLIEAEAR